MQEHGVAFLARHFTYFYSFFMNGAQRSMSVSSAALRRLATLALGLWLCMLWGSQAATAQADKQRPDVVRVGGDSQYPPFEAIGPDGEPTGFNVALLQAIGEEAGLTIEHTLGPWPEIMEAFRDGRIDAVPMFVTEERRREFLFTDPFTIVYHKILVRTDDSGLRAMEELAGRDVLVQQGAWAYEHLRRHVPEARIIPVDSEPEAVRLLAEGQGDATLVTRIGARMAIRSHEATGLRISSPPVAPCEYAIAVRPDRPGLRDRLDAGLDALVASGRFDEIDEHWFGDLLARDYTLKEALRQAGWVLALLIALTATGIVLSYILRRLVAKRTAQLAASNRMLRLLSDSNQALIRITDDSQLLDTVCRILVEDGGYALAWVGLAQDDDQQTVRPVGQCGCTTDCLRDIQVFWSEHACEFDPVGRAIRHCEPVIVADITDTDEPFPWRDAAMNRGARAVCALPLSARGRTFGALAVCSATPNEFADLEECDLLRELADDLAFGLDAIRMRSERDESARLLAENQARFRMLVEHGQDIVCAADAEGILTYVSPSIRRYGYEPDELQARSFLSFIAESDREDIATQFTRVIETGENIPSEFRLLAGDGSVVWVGARGTVLTSDAGTSTGMIVVLRDISEHKYAELVLQHRAAMREIQADLSLRCLQLSDDEMDRALQNALREMGQTLHADRTYVFQFDPGRQTMSNTYEWCVAGIEPQMGNLQRIPVGAFPWWMSRLRRFESLNIPCVDDLPAEAAAEKETFQTQGIRSLFVAPVFCQEELLGFMGLDFVRQQRECPEADRNEVVTMANTLGLLLAHRSAEQSLRDQENLYHTLVEDMPGLICRFKADGALAFVNDEYCRFFEKTREELIGHSFMPLIPEEDQTMVYEKFASCSPTQPTVEYQHRVILPSGQARWTRWIDRALFNENGAITEYQSIGIDITEKHDLEAQLAQSQKLETIGLLAGGIAHDFNNGLQAIHGFTEMVLYETPKEDPRHEDLKEVTKAVGSAQRLTRQLLAFSRSQPLKPEPVDLNELIRSQRKMLARMLGEDVRIELHLAEDVLPVIADPGQVEQIVYNLAVNARDAMPDGGLLSFRTAAVALDEETAKQHPDARPVQYTCLAVSDTGCGIPPDVVERIFEPFFTTKEKGKGTGLGLSTVHGIVRQHEGWVHIYSQAGQGTTFKIFLPVVPEKAEAHEPDSPSDTEENAAKTTGNILVVEDEQHLARLAARMLEAAGHRVTLAMSAAEARKAFDAASGAFDILFTDVVLGDGNGVDLALEFQQKRPDLRVLFASGYADERSRWRIIEQRGWTCLMKPFARADLLSAVKEQLGEAG